MTASNYRKDIFDPDEFNTDQSHVIFNSSKINSISNRVDRDVWRYRGGWYTNPDTQVSTPWCRHEWIQQLVVKR
jgi:hypothetical protein